MEGEPIESKIQEKEKEEKEVPYMGYELVIKVDGEETKKRFTSTSEQPSYGTAMMDYVRELVKSHPGKYKPENFSVIKLIEEPMDIKAIPEWENEPQKALWKKREDNMKKADKKWKEGTGRLVK